MLRRRGLAFFQFSVEDAALAFFHGRQSGELLFTAQNIGQHLALHSFPSLVQNFLPFGGEFFARTFGGEQGFQIAERLTDRHQGSGDDQLQDVLLPLGQCVQISLQHTTGRQDSVMVGDFFPVDGAPCPGNGIVHIFRSDAEKSFQFLGQFFQHFFILVCDIAAIGAWVGGEFFLIKALRILQRLMRTVTQQTVCITLECGEVIERRWIFGLFLARDFLNRGYHLLSALRKELFCCIFFRNAAAGCHKTARQFQSHRVELFRHKSGNGGFSFHRHGKCRGHNTPDCQRPTIQAGKKPGTIDADHPIGTFPAECSLIQCIIFS